MENICWFCETNEANEEVSYPVVLKKHDDRKDKKAININRCEECAKKHRKADVISNIMYALVVVLVGVAYFVFKIEVLYIVIGYIVLRRLLSTMSVKIRELTAQPYKSVCTVADNEGIKKELEEGYIENRRF